MRKTEDPGNRNMIEMLERLRPAPERNPEATARGRAKFIAQLESIEKHAPVAPLSRFFGWAQALKRRERFPVLPAVTSVIVVLVLAFGGVSATVYAAQNDLPDHALYPIKIASENLRLRLAGDEQAKVDLLLNFSGRRVEEIIALSKAGETIPDEVLERLQNQTQQALQVTNELDKDEMTGTLLKVHRYIQDRDRIMANAQEKVPEHAQAVVVEAREMLQNQLHCMEGLEDSEGCVPLELHLQSQFGRPLNDNSPVLDGNEILDEEMQAGEEPAPDLGETGPGPQNPDSSQPLPQNDGTGPGPYEGPNLCVDCEPILDGAETGAGPGPGSGQRDVDGDGTGVEPGAGQTEEYSPGDGSDSEVKGQQHGSGR